MTSKRTRAAVLVSMLVAAACATDGTTEETGATTTPTTAATTTTSEPATTTTEESTTTTAAAEADLSAFCDAAIQADLTAAVGPDVDFETATQEEIEEALAGFGEQLMPLLEEFEATAPEELSGPVSTITEQWRTSLESGEDPMEVEAFQEADRTVDRFILDNCEGLNVVEVTLDEYVFEGVPAMVESGLTAFSFANVGEELHELILFRVNDDVDASLEELLELPEEEAQQMVRFITGGFAAPDEEGAVFADLGPGRYGMICFIPVGTTSFEDLPEDEGQADAPPHFAQGMVAEFDVEG